MSDRMELEGLKYEKVTTGWLGERGEAAHGRLTNEALVYWYPVDERQYLSNDPSGTYMWRGPAPDPTEQHDDLPGPVAKWMCKKHAGEVRYTSKGGVSKGWMPGEGHSFDCPGSYSWRPSPQEESCECSLCKEALTIANISVGDDEIMCRECANRDPEAIALQKRVADLVAEKLHVEQDLVEAMDRVADLEKELRDTAEWRDKYPARANGQALEIQNLLKRERETLLDLERAQKNTGYEQICRERDHAEYLLKCMTEERDEYRAACARHQAYIKEMDAERESQLVRLAELEKEMSGCRCASFEILERKLQSERRITDGYWEEMTRLRSRVHVLDAERAEVWAEREAIEALERERDKLAARNPLDEPVPQEMWGEECGVDTPVGSKSFSIRDWTRKLIARVLELAARFPDPTKEHDDLEIWQFWWLHQFHEGESCFGGDGEWRASRIWGQSGPLRWRPKPTETRQEGLTLAEAAERLCRRLREVHDDATYRGVWIFAHNHLGPYSGPGYAEELAELEALVRKEGGE